MSELRNLEQSMRNILKERGVYHAPVVEAAVETLRQIYKREEIRAEEREECARIADKGLTGFEIAAAIRARGEK